MHKASCKEVCVYGMIVLEDVCDDENYLLCSCSFDLVVFQLFNYPVCANIKEYNEGYITGMDISWVTHK